MALGLSLDTWMVGDPPLSPTALDLNGRHSLKSIWKCRWSEKHDINGVHLPLAGSVISVWLEIPFIYFNVGLVLGHDQHTSSITIARFNLFEVISSAAEKSFFILYYRQQIT